ncbi:hypothetical protein ABB26_05660 [Stenotrophomonas humi]|uniref:DUF1963 domain-containing protein n=1 Tax=Stenotrophomonas humi TaxID=405444 RepID=A0A0R0C5H8_9GAMM|nr:DUF1963 domain-containing protein [Stenotrophomonas humi]KRG65020.1 hypothetical protein ABB26_05660 [Stenotrophomonas humi]
MQRTDIDALVDAHPTLHAHRDYLHGIARPSVTVQIDEQGPFGHQSRFGGNPLVGPGFEWPLHPIGEYCFIGHIDFAEIVDRPEALPDSGVLSLFHAQDEEGEVFWGNDGYVLGYYWPDPTVLVPMASPHGRPAPARRIHLRGAIDLPRHRELRNDWPFDVDQLEDLGQALPDDYLLGHPSHYSLAYDPMPGPDWCSLLTVQSHEAFDWCWHDGDKLMVFIEKQRLAARDFSRLKSDAG